MLKNKKYKCYNINTKEKIGSEAIENNVCVHRKYM